jgi:hypothetical protein
MEMPGRSSGRPDFAGLLSRTTNFSLLVSTLPEAELWRLLQEVVAAEITLEDDVVRRLDSRMQGFMFLQDCVVNRNVRIEFARSPEHLAFLRDAAGSRNVSMSDETFMELVETNDAASLACFARNEQMKPHHLFYIVTVLAKSPHGQEMLASVDDARITLKKALESQEQLQEMKLMRWAQAVLGGQVNIDDISKHHVLAGVAHSNDDPRALWRVYLNLKRLDDLTLKQLFPAAGVTPAGLNPRSLH